MEVEANIASTQLEKSGTSPIISIVDIVQEKFYDMIRKKKNNNTE